MELEKKVKKERFKELGKKVCKISSKELGKKYARKVAMNWQESVQETSS